MSLGFLSKYIMHCLNGKPNKSNNKTPPIIPCSANIST